MNELFSPEGKFMTTLNRSFDILLVNLLTLVCCIPIVTIGPALVAKYYVTMKIVRGRQPRIWSEYFKSFNENFKQAFLIWLPYLVFMGLIGIEMAMLASSDLSYGFGLAVAMAVILAVLGMTLIWGFPMLARFHATYKQWFRAAFALMLLNIGKGIVAILMMVATVVLIYYLPQWLIVWLVIPIIYTYMISVWSVKILKKLEPEDYVDPDEELDDMILEEEEEE